MPLSPAVTRELSIVYGSVTTGGSSVYHIDKTPGLLTWRVSPTEASVTWHVTVMGASSASDLETACDTLETEFAKRFLAFSVVNDSVTVLSWNPSSSVNTGFLAQPSIERIEHPAQTGRSRVYRCSVSVQLPATDNTGRRFASIELDIDDGGVKTVTISGQYTAQSTLAARANYESKIGAFASAALTAFGGSYNLPKETVTADDQDKICDFHRIYREINFAETAGGNIASILSHTVTFDLAWTAPGDAVGGPYGDAVRLQEVTATYAAGVDARVTTDLKTLWYDTLLPYVIAQASVAYPGTAAVVSEMPSFDRQNNKISARVGLQIASVVGLIEYHATQSCRAMPGKITVAVWDGNPYRKNVYQGPADTFRTTTVTMRSFSPAYFASVQGTLYASGGSSRTGRNRLGPDSGWVLVEDGDTGSPMRVGITKHGKTFVVWERTLHIVESWAEGGPSGPAITASESGGSGSPVGSPTARTPSSAPSLNGMDLRPPPART